MRRHGAFHSAIVFVSASWLVLQAADVFGLPTSAVRALGVVLLIVFLALILGAWIAAGRLEEPTAAVPAAAKGAGSRRVRSKIVVAAAAVLLLAGFGAWWARPKLFGSVRPGADVIAVRPCSTSGQSVELRGAGVGAAGAVRGRAAGRGRDRGPAGQHVGPVRGVAGRGAGRSALHEPGRGRRDPHDRPAHGHAPVAAGCSGRVSRPGGRAACGARGGRGLRAAGERGGGGEHRTAERGARGRGRHAVGAGAGERRGGQRAGAGGR